MRFPICLIISVNSYELFYLKKQLGFPSQNNGEKETNPSVFLLLTTLFKIRRRIYIFNVVFQLQKVSQQLHDSIHPSIIHRIGSDRIKATYRWSAARRVDEVLVHFAAAWWDPVELRHSTTLNDTRSPRHSKVRCHKRHTRFVVIFGVFFGLNPGDSDHRF